MKKILIVVANYYPEISEKLLETAKSGLNNYDTKIIYAPGIFEIPVIISKHIDSFEAVIALGCVIKGETPHFDFISQAFNNGIMKISIENKKPIGNGVLTCLNKDQALARVNKGLEAANATIQVLNNEITR
tara:strand:+ start:41 stop:433 length:393 start_codon:yes stop_codon:yes gene_type:complete